jgi:hypothetical protein
MPHSTSDVEGTESEVDMIKEVMDQPTQSGSQTEDEDQEMTKAEEVEDKEGDSASAAASRPEVKLEDLFADIESDEEFPSSAGNGVAASSPQAPASPLWVPKKKAVNRTNLYQKHRSIGSSFRPRSNAILLSASISMAIPLPMAQPLPSAYYRLWTS